MNDPYVPFFHVGILVHDIDAAAGDFSRLLGLEFEPVRSAPVASGEMMRFRYSLAGPPYLELVQIMDTGIGIWGPGQGEGLHHIAFADPDVPGTCAAFSGQADTVVGGEGGSPRVVFTRPEALHGIRVEYLQSAMVAATFERLREAAR
jgi:catechol 2,3-dioxygenase-like lactoylglutathione lyase family enzyme